MTLRSLARPGALALTGLVALAACDAEPTDVNPEELITEVQLTLTNTADASDVATITASDPDGDGAGLTFSPASLALRAGATYDGTIRVADTVNDDDITAEIREEAEEHLFRYTLAPGGSVALTDRESDYTQTDANGGDFAVGLRFRATAPAAAGAPTLGVVLYHFDDAPKTGDTATSDEIDIDIDVPVTVQAPTLARR